MNFLKEKVCYCNTSFILHDKFQSCSILVDLSSWKMKILEEARLEDVDFFLRKGDSSDVSSRFVV